MQYIMDFQHYAGETRNVSALFQTTTASTVSTGHLTRARVVSSYSFVGCFFCECYFISTKLKMRLLLVESKTMHSIKSYQLDYFTADSRNSYSRMI